MASMKGQQGYLFEQLPSPSNLSFLQWKPRFHISELYNFVDLLITKNPYLNDLHVIGEISKITFHTNNHLYLDLQDQSEGNGKRQVKRLSSVLYHYPKRLPQELRPILKEGQLVEVVGDLVLRHRDGALSLEIKEIRPCLTPGWMEERKRKLFAWIKEKGLDAPERKKALPTHIWRVAIVTSETGAVIEDIKCTIWRRNPLIQIYLVPSIVQGERVLQEVPLALQVADRLGVDVILLARGGGSPEDLWYFNEEEIILAVAHTKTPIITAIGHEIDKPLVDLVADQSAATPTAAAELVSPPLTHILANLTQLTKDLQTTTERLFQKYRMLITILKHRLLQEFQSHFHRQIQRLYKRKQDFSPLIASSLSGQKKRLALLNERTQTSFSRHCFLLKQRLKENQFQLEKRFFSSFEFQRKSLNEKRKHAEFLLLHLWKTSRQHLQQLNHTLNSSTKGVLMKKKKEQEQLLQTVEKAFQTALKQQRKKLLYLQDLLHSYNYQSVLERGFSLVFQNQRRVSRYHEFEPNQPYRIQWIDGAFKAGFPEENRKMENLHAKE